MSSPPSTLKLIVGRYAIYDMIASGGMGTVHLARLMGPAGFSRTVAVKRLHSHLIQDAEFPAMLIDEARVAARVRHPKVVSTLDVVATQGEFLLVMEYIHGESLLKLSQGVNGRNERIPLSILTSMFVDALHGLHAAHEATDEQGRPLGVVHRDISPQNLLVGIDGITRIADFGIAKAAGRKCVTGDLSLKGKLAYMAPEQIEQGEVTRATDLFATAIVLWELLTGRPLFAGDTDGQTIHNVLRADFVPPSSLVPDLPPEFDAILARGLARQPKERYATAREMAAELERCVEHARPSEIGPWVEEIARPALTARSALIRDIELEQLPEFAEPGITALSDFDSAKATEGPVKKPAVVSTRRVAKVMPLSAPSVPVLPLAFPAPNSDRRHESSPMKATSLLGGNPAPLERRTAALRWLALTVIAAAVGILGYQASLRPAARRELPGALSLATPKDPTEPVFGTPISRIAAQAPEMSSVASSGLKGVEASPEGPPVTSPPARRPLGPTVDATSTAVDHGSVFGQKGATGARRRVGRITPNAAGSASVRIPIRVPAPRINCDPPYTVDSAGRNIFKLECM